jgi:prefoldin subunit 5
MEQKLQELRREFELGQQQMALLDQRRQELRDTMLRISGAIQVLEELIAQNGHGETEDITLESAS